jgi:hypothetical protein
MQPLGAETGQLSYISLFWDKLYFVCGCRTKSRLSVADPRPCTKHWIHVSTGAFRTRHLKVCVWNPENLRGKWQTSRFVWRFNISAGTRQQCSSCLSSLCFLGKVNRRIRRKKNLVLKEWWRCVSPAVPVGIYDRKLRISDSNRTVGHFCGEPTLFVHTMGPSCCFTYRHVFND